MVVVCFLMMSLVLVVSGVLSKNMYLLTFSLFSLFITDFYFAWKRRNGRGVVVLYMVSFFTFLLGKMLVLIMSGEKWWIDFQDEASIVIVISLYLSLLCLPIGVKLSERYKLGFGNQNTYLYSDNEGMIEEFSPSTLPTRKIAYTLYWMTLFATAYNVLDRVIFVLRNSYVAAYTSYSGVGLLISRLADINKIVFFIYLATMPPKEQAKKPIIMWVILNGFSILAGGRTTIVITFLVLLYYFLYRNDHRQEDEPLWLTRGMKRFLIIASPIAVVFLSAWNYLRNGTNINMGILDLIFNFLENQGGSYKHIAYAYSYADRLPQKFYTFGPIINFLRGNIFATLITGFKMPAQNTVAMATTGYSFGQAISYIHEPWNYLAGLGMGSSYIAELYFDFGYFGVAMFNILLGVVFSRMSRVSPKGWTGLYFTLLVLDSILNLPRNACMSWFTSLTSITMWGTLIFIYLLTHGRSLVKKY